MHLGKRLSRATSLVLPEIPVRSVELAEALGLVVVNDAMVPLELSAAPLESSLVDVLRKVEEVRRGR